MASTKTTARKFSNTPMSPELFTILNRMAADTGTPRAEFVRSLIQDHYTKIQEANDMQDPCPHTLSPLEFIRGTHRHEDIYRCRDCGAEFEQTIPF